MCSLPSLSAAAAASPGSELGNSAEGTGSPGRPRWETLRGKQSKRAGLAAPPPAARRCQSQGPAPRGLGGPAASTPLRQLGGAPPEGRSRARPAAGGRPLPSPRGWRWIPAHAPSPRRRPWLNTEESPLLGAPRRAASPAPPHRGAGAALLAPDGAGSSSHPPRCGPAPFTRPAQCPRPSNGLRRPARGATAAGARRQGGGAAAAQRSLPPAVR